MRTRPSREVPAADVSGAACPFGGQAATPVVVAATDASAAACPFSAPASGTISRRGVLAGAALLATAPLLGARAATSQAALPPISTTPVQIAGAPSGAAVAGPAKWTHASEKRGYDIVARFGQLSEARFGRMFNDLPSYTPPEPLLMDLGTNMHEQRSPAGDIIADFHDNFFMPAGFTYLGQFIDHDITHDTTPLADAKADPYGVRNFDSPFLDLSSVYGKGPIDDPQLYEADRIHLRLDTNVNGLSDLPRAANGTAFVGDPRNDENLIISQMQQAFIMLHNHFVDDQQINPARSFARARKLTTWHYQWVVVHDFLPHVVGQELVDSMMWHIGPLIRAQNYFYQPGSMVKPMMPIEFSAAAYRWGHSAIRPEYEMREVPNVDPNPSILPIFNGDTGPNPRDLRGSRPLYFDAQVDWNYFFEIPGVIQPDDRNFTRLIDTNIALPLKNLPDSVVAHVNGAILDLAQRNLLRGARLGVPAGQDVAAKMKQRMPSMPPPLTNAQLDPNGATFGLNNPGWGGKAPLWFYVLREAELGGGAQLGPVGGRIVAEVLLGLLKLDLASYWNQAVPFTPVGGPNFMMGDLLKLAGAPIVEPNCETLGEIGCLVSG